MALAGAAAMLGGCTTVGPDFERPRVPWLSAWTGGSLETLAADPRRPRNGWMQEWWRAGRTGVPLSFRDYAVERKMGKLGWIGRVFALYQRWDMFESVGPEIRGWPVIVGTLSDGRKVSVLDEGALSGRAEERLL